MRIGIDARFLTHPQKGGFKTYSQNLISALAEVDKENSYFLYLDRIPTHTTKLPKQPNFNYRVISGENAVFGMPWREQITLPYFVAKDRLDLFHAPCLTAPLQLKCILITTIHDMIWYSSRYSTNNTVSIKRKLMDWYYYQIPQRAARKSSLILTVSKASKDRITQELGILQSKVVVTYEATNPIFHQINDINKLKAFKLKYCLPSKYILAIGSTDPRKNIPILIQAYSELPDNLKADYQLVILWTHSLMTKGLSLQIEELGLTEKIRFISDVSDEHLVLLYNAASLFVFPSLEEGFGLPPLEAMACGIPVIAGKNSSLPEILGDAAILTEVENPQKIAQCIINIIGNMDIKNELVRKGLNRTDDFTWQKCARQTLQAYCDVV